MKPSVNGVARSGVLAMLGLIALGGTRIIHGILINRATDNETFGLVGVLIGIGMTAGLFLPGGLASAASKFIPFHRGRGDHDAAGTVYAGLRWTGIASALLLGLVVGVGSAFILDLSWGNTIAVGLFTAVFSMYSVEKGALYGFDRAAPYAKLEIAGSVVAVLTTVVVVVAGLHTYLAPLIIGYSVLILGAWVVLRRRHTPVPVERAHRREIGEYVLLASVGGLASAGLLQLLPLMAKFFTTPIEVSYFAAATVLVTPLYFLPRALGMALFPAMAHAHGAGDTDAVRRHADLSTRSLLVLLAPLFGVAVVIAHEVLLVFGGGRYIPGTSVLQLLLVATYLAVIQVAAVNALSSGTPQEVRIPVTSAVIGAVLGLVVLVPLGLTMGSVGVGLAYLIGVGAGAAGPIVATWRRYDMAWTSPLVRSLFAVVVALTVGLVMDGVGLGGATRILLDLALAVLVLVAAGLLLRTDITGIVKLIKPAKQTSRAAPVTREAQEQES